MELHVSGWHRAHEAMVAGPSGLMMAHFKVGTRHPLIAEVEAVMANIPYISGISSACWWRGINILIPKKLDDNHIDWLQPILLMEPNFN